MPSDAPALPRFLGELLESRPAERVHATFAVSPEEEPALNVTPGRSAQLPLSFVLEAMGQAASFVAGVNATGVSRFEDVELAGEAALHGKVTFEVIAQALPSSPERAFDVVLRPFRSAQPRFCATARVVLADKREGDTHPLELSAPPGKLAASATGAFARVGSVLLPGPREALFSLTGSAGMPWPHALKPALGDPYARELLLRGPLLAGGVGSIQGFARLELFSGATRDVGRTWVRAQTEPGADGTLEVTRVTEQGRVLERITGLRVASAKRAEASAPRREQPAEARIFESEALRCQTFEQTFRVGWKECSALDRTVLASQFVRWFHHARDLMLGVEMGRAFGRQMQEGTAGGAILSSEVVRTGRLTAYDQVQLQLWVEEISDSTVTWTARFDRVADRPEPVAWVRSRGVYRSARGHALPQSHQALYAPFLARAAPAMPATTLVGPLPNERPVPGPRQLLESWAFRPGPIDSDLLGNVNNAGFFFWQEHVRDLFLQRASGGLLARPSPMSLPGGLGDCGFVQMNHLREAMPFESLLAELSVESFSQSAAVLRTDFVRLRDGQREKVGSGRQLVAWRAVDREGQTHELPWPKRISAELAIEAPNEGQPHGRL